MDTLKDIWASFVAHVHERTSNPFTFAFAASWIGWNYKFFLYIFDNDTAQNRIAGIAKLYPDHKAAIYAEALAYPLVTALVAVFVWPYLTQGILWFYRGRQVAISNTVKTREGERLITLKDKAVLVRRYESELAETAKEVQVLEGRIEALQTALQAAEEDLATGKGNAETSVDDATRTSDSTLEQLSTDSVSSSDVLDDGREVDRDDSKINELVDLGAQSFPLQEAHSDQSQYTERLAQLNSQQIALLRSMSGFSSPQSPTYLANLVGINVSVAMVNLSKLAETALIEESRSVNGIRYTLTPEGREFVVNHGLVK